MAIKPFAIQGADLTLGGVNLQAGSNGVVIPGVTRAATFVPKEVEKFTDDETIWQDPPVLIDSYLWSVLMGGTPAQGWTSPTYSAQLDDEGKIDEINIDSVGAGITSQIKIVMGDNMYAAPDGTSIDPQTFDSQLWVTIPWTVKCEAGEVESIGGGGADTGDITFDGNQIGVDGNNGEIKIRSEDGNDYSYTWQTPQRWEAYAENDEDGDHQAYAWIKADIENGINNPKVFIENSPGNTGVAQRWTFDKDGAITFPDGSIQTTAYTGQTSSSGELYIMANVDGDIVT